MTRTHNNSGRVYDPVFIFMVIAVVLAVGSSLALRCMTPGGGGGPSSALGAEPDLQTQSQGVFMPSLPAPHVTAAHNHSN